MTYTLTQLQEAFDALPNAVKDYLMHEKTFEILDEIINEFDIPEENEKDFRTMLIALEVGLAKPDEFINFLKEELEFGDDIADTLFDEVSEKILDEMYEIFDQTTNGEEVPHKVLEELPAPAKPLGDIKKFVGIPAYGVEKPASSYTSVLPRSNLTQNKVTDTAAADSFIQKLNALNAVKSETENTGGVFPPTTILQAPTTTSTTISTTIPQKERPAVNMTDINAEVNKILGKNDSIGLTKLNGPVNIPRQEIDVSPEPTEKSSAAPFSKPAVPPIYPAGTDPYREPPTS